MTAPNQPASAPREIVRLRRITRTFMLGSTAVHALRDVDLTVRAGEFVGIMGPSGSGKSTLLNLLGLLDLPTSGSYHLDDEEVARLSDNALAGRRNARIGFIFQSFNLFPHLSVAQNIEVPMVYAETPLDERHRRSRELAEAVGLGHRLKHRPSELSGGECQRIAIARALANRPSFLLADEPTGNLDDKTGQEIIGMLTELNQKQGATLIMVTHNPELRGSFHRTVNMRDGQIV